MHATRTIQSYNSQTSSLPSPHCITQVAFKLTAFSILCKKCIMPCLKASLPQMSLIMRKPVFGVCNLERLKQACAATETSWTLEISGIASIGTILSRKRTIKALITLLGCTGWSAPLMFTQGINWFSHDVAPLKGVGLNLFSFLFFLYRIDPIKSKAAVCRICLTRTIS